MLCFPKRHFLRHGTIFMTARNETLIQLIYELVIFQYFSQFFTQPLYNGSLVIARAQSRSDKYQLLSVFIFPTELDNCRRQVFLWKKKQKTKRNRQVIGKQTQESNNSIHNYEFQLTMNIGNYKQAINADSSHLRTASGATRTAYYKRSNDLNNQYNSLLFKTITCS